MTAKLTNQVGRKYTNRHGEVVTVVEYNGKEDVRVAFPDGRVYRKRGVHLQSGKFTSPYTKTVFNTGYLGEGVHTRVSSAKCMSIWSMMIGRCYDSDMQSKNRSYIGCKVDDDWHNFQNYAEWYFSNYVEGWEVDKDILGNGTLYSKSTCCFVPPEINSFFNLGKGQRGGCPVGVYKIKQGYVARCKTGGKDAEWLGVFSDPYVAFTTYKRRKEQYGKELADKYEGRVDERAILRLKNFTVNITD